MKVGRLRLLVRIRGENIDEGQLLGILDYTQLPIAACLYIPRGNDVRGEAAANSPLTLAFGFRRMYIAMLVTNTSRPSKCLSSLGTDDT